MEIAAFFGKKLAELTGLYEIGCVALIKLSVQDAGRDLAHVTYQEMREVFQVHLLKRLQRLQVDGAAQVTARMLAILSTQQSLFTMSAR